MIRRAILGLVAALLFLVTLGVTFILATCAILYLVVGCDARPAAPIPPDATLPACASLGCVNVLCSSHDRHACVCNDQACNGNP